MLRLFRLRHLLTPLAALLLAGAAMAADLAPAAPPSRGGNSASPQAQAQAPARNGAAEAGVSRTAFAGSGGMGTALSRIKDLASVEGVRSNQILGYGIVVGLNGTGDTLNNAPFTKQSLQAMLERLGVNTRGANMRTANVAAVMVTANLPPFATQGTRLDVTVSALGDAKSLQGGTLLVDPAPRRRWRGLCGLAGPVAIAGFSAEGEAAKITRGVPTVGRIANGGLIEREIDFALNKLKTLRLSLRNPDLTTARRIAAAINDFIGGDSAEPTDPSTVVLQIPPRFQGNMIRLLTEVEQLASSRTSSPASSSTSAPASSSWARTCASPPSRWRRATSP
jgi:flagellar P-ring protein precursor FlgI